MRLSLHGFLVQNYYPFHPNAHWILTLKIFIASEHCFNIRISVCQKHFTSRSAEKVCLYCNIYSLLICISCLPSQICPMLSDTNKTDFWWERSNEKSQVEIPVMGSTTTASRTVVFSFKFLLCSGPVVCLVQNVPQQKEYFHLKLQSLESSFLFGLFVWKYFIHQSMQSVIRYSVINLLWFILVRLFYFSRSIFLTWVWHQDSSS